MVTKHTTGPWTHADGSNAAVVWGPGQHAADYQVCRCDRQGTFGDETHNANARLIAAAPELLEEYTALVGRVNTMAAALRRQGLGKWVTEWLSDGILDGAAIAKATGKE